MSRVRIVSLLHASVVVADTARSLVFYREVLGFELNTGRPALDFPGAWLQAGEQQLHLLEVSNPDPVDGRPSHAGRDRHVAFRLAGGRDGLDALAASLDRAGVAYTRSRSGRPALFCRDPDGNALEFIAEP